MPQAARQPVQSVGPIILGSSQPFTLPHPAATKRRIKRACHALVLPCPGVYSTTHWLASSQCHPTSTLPRKMDRYAGHPTRSASPVRRPTNGHDWNRVIAGPAAHLVRDRESASTASPAIRWSSGLITSKAAPTCQSSAPTARRERSSRSAVPRYLCGRVIQWGRGRCRPCGRGWRRWDRRGCSCRSGCTGRSRSRRRWLAGPCWP